MSELSNAFSLLELDDEDERQHTLTPAATDREKLNGKDMEEGDSFGEVDHTNHDNDTNQWPEILTEEYKKPLVWIDLEMTGLNIETDRILEIACIITDGNLTISLEGPDLIIHQTKECMDRMGEWCQSHHGESGLTERVLQSTISEKEAEKQVADFVKRHVHTHTPMLAGNSVYVDLMFLKKYMPDLASLFTHVLVDVSSVKALCFRWFPRDDKRAPKKEKKHRAMDDIRESIRELRYYKETIFKASKSGW